VTDEVSRVAAGSGRVRLAGALCRDVEELLLERRVDQLVIAQQRSSAARRVADYLCHLD